MIWIQLQMRIFKRKIESLWITVLDNSKSTNYVKEKIDKAQENNKCMQCGDRGDTVNHIISKCNKLYSKEIWEQVCLVGKGDPLGIEQKTENWPYVI